MHKSLLRIVTILAAGLALLAAAAAMYLSVTRAAQRQALYAKASLLGFQPQDEIAQLRRCWDFNGHCGQFLYFHSALDRAALQSLVEGLDLKPVNALEVDGYAIFTAINFGASRSLTLDGSELDSLEQRRAHPAPDAFEWRFEDQRGRRWTVTHYEMRQYPGQVELDGAPLTGSIVVVLLQTR